MSVTVDVPYRFTPRDYQLPLLRAMDSGYRRAVQVWHRRAGKEKTDFGGLVVKKALERVGSYYYFFPELAQGRKVLWDGMDRDGMRFIDHVPRELMHSPPNNTEMKVRLKKPGSSQPGSMIQVVGTDRFNSVMGTNPVGGVFSEYSLQDPACWGYFRPIFAENDGWAVFNFTPRGENHAYQLYQLALADPATWFVSHLTVDDTGAVSREVLEQERREIIALDGSDAQFMQEYYCSFKVAIPGAYYAEQISAAYRDAPPRISRVPHDPAFSVSTAWDLGLNDRMAVWFFQTIGRELRVVDYQETVGKGLDWWASEILPRRGYAYDRHFAPHDIAVRELTSGKARIDTARRLGIRFSVVPDVPVLDGIDQGRALLAKAWIDEEKCRAGLNALKSYRKRWSDDRKTFENKPYHDWSSNGADAWRYLAVGLNPTYQSPQARDMREKDAYARERDSVSDATGVDVLG